MFITFEGLDFCGKSTQISLLKEKLEKENKKVIVIREPGGTKISEKIRELLLDKKNSEMDIHAELLLFAASRSQLVKETIIPKLKEGYFVLSDRFHDSSIAYQGYGRGIEIDFVKQLQNFAIGEAIPDLTFLVDLPIEETERRKNLANADSLDRMERLDREFFTNVRNGYLELSKNQKRFVIIDGTKSIKVIHDEISSIVFSR